MNDGLFTDDRIVVTIHEDLPRGSSEKYSSELTMHPVILGPEQIDTLVDEEGELVLNSDHKIGGRPYCLQEPELPGAEELFTLGYRQVLQLDFPGYEDGEISGDWPNYGGLFNLFWNIPFDAFPYQWYFQG